MLPVMRPVMRKVRKGVRDSLPRYHLLVRALRPVRGDVRSSKLPSALENG